MINKFKEINWNPGPVERKKFGLTLLIGLPCSGLMLLLLGRLVTHAWKFQGPIGVAGGGMGLGLALFLVPAIALPFYRLWYAVICTIDFVVTHVLLFLSYYGLIVPAGIIYRMIAPASFQKRIDRSCSTYWKDIKTVSDVRRYYQQF
jgi:hypothetical protein